jgi:DNA repair protein RecN (Recombination protein N)
MLSELLIRNFAIIDRLQVAFGPGFNVLTGETGAGKSIIIDAVGLLLGDRARPDLIRNGEEEASVEALFDLSTRPDLRRALAEGGGDEADELLVRRVVARSGKNRIYLNGSLATLAQLQPLTGQMVTIYGQHEHQGLLRSETHLLLLDRFAGAEETAAACQRLHRELRGLDDHLRRLEEAERQRQQRLDLLTFQSGEITAAALRPGEEEELAAERLLLQHAGRLAAAAEGGYEALYGAEGAVCERLGSVAGELEGLAPVDPTLAPLAEAVRGALYALEDVARELRDRTRRVAFDPQRQAAVEERLALLATLKRKYGATLEAVLAYRETIDREIAELTDLDAARHGLCRQREAAAAELARTAELLSGRRQEAARRLRAAVEAELAELAMPRARFEVRLSALPEPGPRGAERVEFFLAANPGEEARPLARVASGGELSRLMLALQRATPGGEGIPTLIFDEVDAGIGGAAATAVGRKLKGAAQAAQVLCITHLPQVAAFADRHFRVEKREADGRTATLLAGLDGEARVHEMARMLGGATVTDRTLEHARELIGLCAG